MTPTKTNADGEGSLWVGTRSMPCSARAWGEGRTERGTASWSRWVFRATIPAARRRRDRELSEGSRPFTAMFFLPVPAGQEVVGVEASVPAATRAGQAREVLSSFLLGQTLAVAIDDVAHGLDVEVVVYLGPARRGTGRAAAPRSPARGRPVARLRAYGHRFLLEHRRLPAVSEIAAGLGIGVDEAGALAELTHAPVCEESVTRGALPRLRIAGASAGMAPTETRRLPGAAGERDSASVEEIGERFEVTRERIRPISASALRKLRRGERL